MASRKEVNVPATVKETYFFSDNYHKGEQWFDKQFGSSDELAIRGEVGPTYFPNTRAVELVKKHSPDAKIIITLREPYSRFLSHYFHNVNTGFIEKGTRLDATYEHKKGVRTHSEYFNNVMMWKEIFGDQVSILLYEDLKFRPDCFARNICESLSINHYSIPDNLDQRVGERRNPMNTSVLRSALSLAKYLRKHDMHVVVNLSKKLGLIDFLYSKSNPIQEKIDGGEEVFSIVQQDSIRLKRELDLDISHWESIWSSSEFQQESLIDINNLKV